MLRGVSLYLTNQFRTVSVIARDEERLAHLSGDAQKTGGDIQALALDYRDEDTLRSRLQASIQKCGSITLAVSWIHSIAPRAPLIISEAIAENSQGSRYFEIVGSAAADPALVREEHQKRFQHFKKIQHRQVILGFIVEARGSRWLTDEEISNGVIRAIELDEIYSIVGTVHPWSARP
jgi:hypothetical protein